MKKLNKFIFGSASITAVAAPIAATVSCGATKYEYYFNAAGNSQEKVPEGYAVSSGEVVSYVTDGGSITDKSFNEGTLNGVKVWSALDKANTYKVYETQHHGTNDTDYTTQYDASVASQKMVVAGYSHTLSGRLFEWIKNHQEKQVIGIDIPDSDPNNKLKGITFKTEQSGFLAAVEAGYQLNEQFKTEKTNEDIKVATFGGVKIPTVTSYMNGFAAGVEYFNTHKKDAIRGLQLVHAGSGPDSDFSDNFNAGGGTPLANTFLNKGVRLIMAVAGPQTNDVVEAIKSKKLQSKAFAIGVDVDQSQVYGGVVIGSAIKGLQAATKAALSDPVVGVDHIYGLPNQNNEMFVGYAENKNYSLGEYKDSIKTEAELAAGQYDLSHSGVSTVWK